MLLPRFQPKALIVGATVAVLQLWPAVARSEPKDSAPETFEYATPAEKNYLRAIIELEALSTVSEIWYVIDVRHGGDVGYRWQTFQKKLSGTAIGHDDNGFGTNFRGHGVGGNAYYLSARGNHLSIEESFGFAVAGAVLWEYFGEISEVVSVNDVIVTPFSGIGIGEPLTQLSAFFDRQSPTFANRALGTLFGPIKSANDALDGATLSRTSTAHDEWHRFTISASAAFEREQSQEATRTRMYRDEERFGLSERLARLREYDGATDRSEWFSDGNLSDMSLRVAAGPHGPTDFAFASDVVPFGYYERHARQAADGVHGGGMVVGFEMGYRYLVHDYGNGGPASSLDRSAFVQPAGLMFEYRGAFGPASITSKVDVAATYGGVHPIASAAFGDRSTLTPVLRNFDYYFGAGGQIESSLTLQLAGLEADGSMLGRRFVCVDEHVQQSISDTWQRFGFGFGYRLRPMWMLRFFSEDTVRAGRLAAARGVVHESAAGLEARAIF